MQRFDTWYIQSVLENMKKKLTCHCGGVEAEVDVPEKGFEKIMRCNCSICKKKDT